MDMSMNLRLSKRLLKYTKTKKETTILGTRLSTTSNRNAAKKLGIPRRTVDRVINRIISRAEELGEHSTVQEPRILILDIETAPLTAYLWGLWQNGVSPDNVIEPTYVLSWAAKWLNDDMVMWDALCNDEDYVPGGENDERMLHGIWDLLNKADIVVAHNGDKFDIKRLNTRFLLAGFPPPTPYKTVDTLKVVKRNFAFDSNRLSYLLRLVVGVSKGESGGFETWTGCMAGDTRAWADLVRYNCDDVEKLEQLYLAIRGWDHLHPSAATHGSGTKVPLCPTCSSEDVSPTESTIGTRTGQYRVWKCNDCGANMRERHTLVPRKEAGNILVGVK